MVYLALNGLLGSQGSFLFNQIGSVWQSAPDGITGVSRFGVRTYTTTEFESVDQVAGGDVGLLLAQVAKAVKVNFTVTVISSKKIGTQALELSGAPGFDIDPTSAAATVATAPPQRHKGLSGGAIAGIVVGILAAAAAALTAFALFALSRRRRKRAGTLRAGAIKSGGGNTASSNSEVLHPILDSTTTSPLGSSGFTHPGGSGIKRPAIAAPSQSSTKSDYASSLSEAWRIDASELAVCQHPDGSDWVLGAGSFGIVYRGVKGGVQPVAIKQMITPGNTHLRMFEKEVALLRHLSYDRNLVHFYSAVIAQNNLMLVLELMDGGDLREALGNDENMQLGWYQQGAHILCDIARGLHFLHSNKVAHRDLKTKNVLLNSAGEAKIADVGLAQLVGSQLLSTQLDNAAGTFAYAAPELLMGEPCDTRADLFSVGVIMWEVVTHECPVRGNLRGIATPSEAPLEVTQLIEKCLRRQPERRPSARTIFEVLTSLLPAGSSARPILASNTPTSILGGNSGSRLSDNPINSLARIDGMVAPTSATQTPRTSMETAPEQPSLSENGQGDFVSSGEDDISHPTTFTRNREAAKTGQDSTGKEVGLRDLSDISEGVTCESQSGGEERPGLRSGDDKVELLGREESSSSAMEDVDVGNVHMQGP